ncbi:Aste57867_3294 [Aphanomyces stellatus]|uniref:Aste57867_3294 protein n=1 Tax=Aphanomyces stellatus TaxID=120398 RepID=A0A485KD86_9STRA|nr:hypothetical protein As57867_003284 [Aphanomyces stellatus]VFT80465.1 Aste57867_3294 [Aphanomyces stellatus]
MTLTLTPHQDDSTSQTNLETASSSTSSIASSHGSKAANVSTSMAPVVHINQRTNSTVFPPSDASEPNPPAPRVATLGHKISTPALVFGCVGGVLLLLAIVVMFRRREGRSVIPQVVVSIDGDYSALNWRDLDLIRLHTPPLPLGLHVATGASGAIFLGTFLDESVVVKMLPPTTKHNLAEIQAFVDEIQFMARLKSPFIVTLEGVAWTHPTDLQAVMEYMNMGDLRSHLAKTTPKTFTWAAKITCARSIAEGLFYLHSQNLIHRDLKSRNILLDSVKGTKLADFGLSKEVVYGDTMTAVVGTFRWMAPEMLLFQGYSNAVDIFSFGVVLSELDTHALPYSDVVGNVDGRVLSDEAMARRVIHEGLRPSFRPECPDWFKTLALQCMAPNPDDRPSAPKIMYLLDMHTQ